MPWTLSLSWLLGILYLHLESNLEHLFSYDLQSVQKLKDSDFSTWEAVEVLTGPNLLKRTIVPRFLWKLFQLDATSPQIAKAKSEIFSLFTQMTHEKRKLGLDQVQSTWGMDILQRLLQGGEEGILSDEEIYGEILGLFLAGHETTSNTLTFAVLELCRNPDVCEKLYNLIKDVQLEDLEDPMKAINQIKYLDNIMREVQRLHSVVGSTGI